MTINYTAVNEAPLDDVTRDWLCWHGEMDFARHFWRLLGLRSAAAQLCLHEPLSCARQSIARNMAQQAHETITAGFVASAQTCTGQSSPTWLAGLKTNALTMLKRRT